MPRKVTLHSWIFARISESLKRKYSCGGKCLGSDTSKDQFSTYLLAYFNGISSPSGQQYTVSSLNASRDNLALFVRGSGADSNDGSLR
jgi:hypothetical protein